MDAVYDLIHDVNVDQGGEFQVAEHENNTKLHQAGGGRVGAEKGEEIGEDEILKITESLKPIIRGRIRAGGAACKAARPARGAEG